MNGNLVLVIFHTKQVESGSEYLKIGIYMLFYKVWHSSPPLLSQTIANRILWVPVNSLIPWRSALFSSFYRLQWSDQLSCKISDEQMKHASQGVLNLIRKKTNPTTTSSWAKNGVTKWEVFWRFWKVAHGNLLAMVWNAMHRNL
jgi:hypothetical protein